MLNLKTSHYLKNCAENNLEDIFRGVNHSEKSCKHFQKSKKSEEIKRNPEKKKKSKDVKMIFL